MEASDVAILSISRAVTNCTLWGAFYKSIELLLLARERYPKSELSRSSFRAAFGQALEKSQCAAVLGEQQST
mgnify:FL=1